MIFVICTNKGQCLCDLGLFLEALESFAKASELKPEFKPYHMRRSVQTLNFRGLLIKALGLYDHNWLVMEFV